MKALVIVVLIGAAVFGVVKVLGSTLAPAKYGGSVTGVRGVLERGNVCLSRQDVVVWKEARPTYNRTDRERMRVGMLKVGEEFVVLDHMQNGAPLWVKIRSRDTSLEGWVLSKPQAPFEAEKVIP
jgi:hypothetical protein